MKFFRILLIMLMVICIFVGGYFIGTWVMTGTPPDIINILNPVKSKTILIMGMDNEGLRSDVMMLAFLNGKTGNVDLLSIPRDTKVKINDRTIKINSAFALGRETQSIKTVENLLDIKIDNYVKFSFETFRNVIDALDGVYFDVKQDMKYSDPEQGLNINLKKGYQLLDGDKAEQLVRFRHYPMGDEDRIKVQQEFIKELVRQKATPAIITKLPSLAKEIGKTVETDVPSNEWIPMANIARKINSETFKTYQLPGVAKRINGLSYYVMDDKETKTLIGEFITRQNENK